MSDSCFLPGRSPWIVCLRAVALTALLALPALSASPSERTLTVNGRVQFPDGGPGAGSVVVSSAGGQAISGTDGSFALEVALPEDALELRVTAFAGAQAQGDVLASVQVRVPSGPSLTLPTPLVLAATGGCPPSWLPTFGGLPGITGQVRAFAVYDAGSGPELIVGGSIGGFGGKTFKGIARWNGSAWLPLGGGLNNGYVEDMLVFDDGSGPKLYVAGFFNSAGVGSTAYLARWNGSTWSSVGGGMSGPASALAVYDDGGGAALYAAGQFVSAGGVAVNRIARWNGSGWSSLGTGLDAVAWTLEVYDDGSGEALYAGGTFTSAGGVPANRIARWNGSSWSALGSGVVGTVSALEVFDAGTGAELYVGGDITLAGGQPVGRIARWNGASWSQVGSAVSSSGFVAAMQVFNDGSGPRLYVSGDFDSLGTLGTENVAAWDGVNWSTLGAGMAGVDDQVLALFVHDDGSGPALLAGGAFDTAGEVAASEIARWKDGSWSAMDTGLNDWVYALAVYDDGNGPALYAGGIFDGSGHGIASHIARWNGSQWKSLGGAPTQGGLTPSPSVSALIAFDDGSGPCLYVGGSFDQIGGVAAANVARWDGSIWSPVDLGLDGHVSEFAVFDDGSGPRLVAGGGFLSSGGVTPAWRIARWDGTAWSGLGSGFGGGGVSALAVFDDGGGPKLYAAGSFHSSGGSPLLRIARWDDPSWTQLGAGADELVFDLAVYDDGSGDALFAAGRFTSTPANRVARWNGAAWSGLGSGVNDDAEALAVFDDGTGEALYVGGAFTTAGGLATGGLARWNGSGWAALDGGGPLNVRTLLVRNDETGPHLLAGGEFPEAPDGDAYVARWGCAVSSSGRPYCTAGTSTNGCSPSLLGSGTASASSGSGFTISAAGVEGQVIGLFIYSVSGPATIPWGGGSSSLICVNPPLERMPASLSGGTAATCSGSLAVDWNAYIAGHAGAIGQPFTGGETVWAQAWYRDPPAPKGANFSDGLVIQVAP